MAISKQVSKPARSPLRGERIYRFTLPERVAHWNHALSFLVLLVTGGALVVRGVAPLLGVDLLRGFALTHRIAAVLFTAVTVPVLWLGARQAAGHWVRSSFRLDRDDRQFLARFPRDFFGLPVTLPDQDRFNAGEKINSVLQILGWAIMVVTGWLLVWKDAIPRDLARAALAAHSFVALFLGAVVLGHIYLAAIHPHARPGLPGMISGWVPKWWAKSHYRKWYDRLSG